MCLGFDGCVVIGGFCRCTGFAMWDLVLVLVAGRTWFVCVCRDVLFVCFGGFLLFVVLGCGWIVYLFDC